MGRIALVTDSTSDIRKSVAQDKGIIIIPLTVHFGDESYLDGVEIDSKEFFRKLRAASVMPKTSQPSPADFIRVYESLLTDYDHIFSIHISTKMSGTLQSASIAANTIGSSKIEVIDSENVSLGLGLIVMAAAEAIDKGLSVEDIRKVVEHAKANYGLYFTLDTLEYLQKNGRIGKATAFIGSLLSVKPILTVRNGVIGGVERVRSASRVYPRILELMHEAIPEGQEIDLIVLHADDEPRGEQWLADVKSRFNVRNSWLVECGPIVGTHAGPGTMSVAWRPVSELLK